MSYRVAWRLEKLDLRKVFPAEDPLAVEMARLAILAEDMRTILLALFPGTALHPDPQTKARPVEWEDMLPLMSRTWLVAIENLRDVAGRVRGLLSTSPEIFVAAGVQASQVSARLDELTMLLAEHASRTSDARGQVGGHLDQDHVRRVLESIPPGSDGFWRRGGKWLDCEFKFGRSLAAGLFEVKLQLKRGHQAEAPDWFNAPFIDLGVRAHQVVVDVLGVYILGRTRR